MKVEEAEKKLLLFHVFIFSSCVCVLRFIYIQRNFLYIFKCGAWLCFASMSSTSSACVRLRHCDIVFGHLILFRCHKVFIIFEFIFSCCFLHSLSIPVAFCVCSDSLLVYYDCSQPLPHTHE